MVFGSELFDYRLTDNRIFFSIENRTDNQIFYSWLIEIDRFRFDSDSNRESKTVWKSLSTIDIPLVGSPTNYISFWSYEHVS